MNNLILKIRKEIQEEVTKEILLKKQEKLKSIKENETGADLGEAEAKELQSLYKQRYKEVFNKNYSERIQRIKQFLESDSWKILQELFIEVKPEDYSNSSFTEKQAFEGFRKEIIENVIQAPQQLIDVYEKIQKE